MTEKANITPAVLKWARESAKITIEDAAKKIRSDFNPKNIIEWEEGINLPTINQAKTLAKAYRRPFALLFLPEIPIDFQPLQDFRAQDSKSLSTGSIFIIREIQQKQAWTRDFLIENDEEPLSFVGKFTLEDKPEEVANDILTTLEIDPLNYITNKPIKEWIDKAEQKGVFISRTSFIHSKLKLDHNELQGFALSDKYAPFVFINSDDWEAPQLFTLVHELAHLWIDKSGISNAITDGIDDFGNSVKDRFHPIELFCNEVAANALMPASYMINLQHSLFNSAKDIFRTSHKLGISSYAFIVRLYKLNVISYDEYFSLKKESDAAFSEFLKEEEKKKEMGNRIKTGGPSPYLLRLNKNGRLLTQLVLDSFNGGRLAPSEASSLLNTQINKFYKFENILYR